MSAKPLPPAIFVMGPTASGKTALAMALADRFPVELISVDSAQVFIDMNLGTAKPDAATLARYPHHLIDIITPEERYSAARFCDDALRLMADITARGKVPLLVGGTMLYFKALMDGLAELPKADPLLRSAIDAEALEKGWPAMHAELAKLDPESAARLAPNDSQRIQRALEVVRLTGRSMGEFYASQTRTPLPYRVQAWGLVPSDRAWLHSRIAERFDAMLASGLVAEVEMLRQKYQLHEDLPSMRSVGYRQAWDYIEGRISLGELRDRGIFATRQFAKRQLTWFNTLSSVERLNCQAADTPETIFHATERFTAPPAAPS
ncbi:MAG TPA: tRNA (adenosine(37)-N6)-dimethylallyltransferase MiaA [Rhodocyclaceae bacterium]|nr:tRNA (adenosine(37)-N6)-dimethylallyltransferase MiaA [Rhodocyclaceae bacterium]